MVVRDQGQMDDAYESCKPFCNKDAWPLGLAIQEQWLCMKTNDCILEQWTVDHSKWLRALWIWQDYQERHFGSLRVHVLSQQLEWG